MTDPIDLPLRVIVDQHGHYWRDYGTHLSMPPVSDENVETTVEAVFDRPESLAEAWEQGYATAAAHLPGDDLGTAWAEAEAALPEGWHLDGVHRVGADDLWFAMAMSRDGSEYVDEDGKNPTPAAALRALTARLKEADRD